MKHLENSPLPHNPLPPPPPFHLPLPLRMFNRSASSYCLVGVSVSGHYFALRIKADLLVQVILQVTRYASAGHGFVFANLDIRRSANFALIVRVSC